MKTLYRLHIPSVVDGGWGWLEDARDYFAVGIGILKTEFTLTDFESLLSRQRVHGG